MKSLLPQPLSLSAPLVQTRGLNNVKESWRDEMWHTHTEHTLTIAHIFAADAQEWRMAKSQFVIEFTKLVTYKFLANYLKFWPNQISMIGFNSPERCWLIERDRKIKRVKKVNWKQSNDKMRAGVRQQSGKCRNQRERERASGTQRERVGWKAL